MKIIKRKDGGELFWSHGPKKLFSRVYGLTVGRWFVGVMRIEHHPDGRIKIVR